MTDTITGHAVSTDPWFQRSYTPDSVRGYADRVAPGWHVAHKPEGKGSLEAASMAPHTRSTSSCDSRRQASAHIPAGEAGSACSSCGKNPRLLRSVVVELSTVRKKLGRLPRVDSRARERRAAHRDGGRRLPASDRLGI